MTSRLESVLLWARELPSPGAWALLQLAAAACTTAWIYRQTRSDRRYAICWLLSLSCAAAGAYAFGFAYRLPAWISGRSHDLLGASSLGALGGAALAFALLARRRGMALPVVLDLVAPALILLLAVGRLGCFLGGCDGGTPSSSDWAVRFPAGTATFREHLAKGLVLPTDRWSLAVHPAQLYEVIAAVVVFAVSARIRQTRKWPATTAFAFAALGYGLARGCVDGLRGLETGVTASRAGVLLALALSAIVYLRLRHGVARDQPGEAPMLGPSCG